MPRALLRVLIGALTVAAPPFCMADSVPETYDVPVAEAAADTPSVSQLPEKPDDTPLVDSVPGVPTPADLEKRGARIGKIGIDVQDIFDEKDPREDNAVYRTANDLHMKTRHSTVRGQLLFQSGDAFSVQKADETARILRDKRYLSTASVEPVAYDPDTNTVDLVVHVRDVWSLNPGIGFGRSGGANKSRLRISDENFLGFGTLLALEYKKNVDRSGVGVEFKDNNLRESWWDLRARYADNSDGFVRSFSLVRPFYSLDTRWSLGFAGAQNKQTTPLYDLGEKVDEFITHGDLIDVQGGVSEGLIANWTTRWLGGYRYDRSTFDPTTSGVGTTELPEDRILSYPWVGVEFVQDNFLTTHNQDQIGRTEDIFLGRSLRAEIGFASPEYGSNQSAAIFAVNSRTAFPAGDNGELYLDGFWTGRYEQGSTADALVGGDFRYYHRFNDKNLFTFRGDAAHASNLDLDHQLQIGGDSGLRGYPLRYQNGTTRALMTVEERYYTDWFPFRLVRVGGAVFTDVGRMWGNAPLSTEPLGWLGDVGFGLRLGNVRSGLGNVLHLDVAFPVGGPSDIDGVQFLVGVEDKF